ncbi:hemolysin III [Lactobacillus xylocopicola]|uniref:Hemolysin III n=2 Tax=Lactobacillus xylocopicola TaxID=2976676 RepID=A0ABM8BGV2_9LACO|nr:hemolysin III [Lactobacillus xylocopicola]
MNSFTMNLKKIWLEPQKRPKNYYLLDNIFSAVVHGIGSLLALIGLILLIIKAVSTHSALRITTFTIYGTCLLLLYLFSTLFHSLIFTKARNVFQIFDHSSIFLLIAGTYTPYSLVTLGGKSGWILLTSIWLLALFGILYYIFNRGKHVILDTVLYVGMGWLVMLVGKALYARLNTTGFWLLVGGGVAYTVGALFYTMKRIPYIHVIWHLFVILGSGLMYFSILLYV